MLAYLFRLLRSRIAQGLVLGFVLGCFVPLVYIAERGLPEMLAAEKKVLTLNQQVEELRDEVTAARLREGQLQEDLKGARTALSNAESQLAAFKQKPVPVEVMGFYNPV